jgi:hypothetical protein
LILPPGAQDPEGMVDLNETDICGADEGDRSLHLIAINAATIEIAIEDMSALVMNFIFNTTWVLKGVMGYSRKPFDFVVINNNFSPADRRRASSD